MSSIIREGDTFHGISVFGRGVLTDDYGVTYAGQYRDGYACGLGVLTWSDGDKEYAEHGPDGRYDGWCLDRWTGGGIYHYLYERGEQTDSAVVYADGRCVYNGVTCAPDDPRLLALTAQVAPVEVRLEAPTIIRRLPAHSPASSRPMDRPARFTPPQALATAVAAEVRAHAVAGAMRHNPTAFVLPSTATQ